jgi:hypothetical protein
MDEGDAVVMLGTMNWWRSGRGWKHSVLAANEEEKRVGLGARYNVTFRRRLHAYEPAVM